MSQLLSGRATAIVIIVIVIKDVLPKE